MRRSRFTEAEWKSYGIVDSYDALWCRLGGGVHPINWRLRACGPPRTRESIPRTSGASNGVNGLPVRSSNSQER